ncbi:MAG: biopolymer transporter ExbD [Candidatus Binatia bacterium]
MSALRIRRVVAGGGDAAVELTPLIDMIFLLLVFFLVVTTFRDERRALEVERPAAASADRSRSEKPLTIEIGPDRIAADGTVIPVLERAYLVCKQPSCSAKKV